MSNFDLIWTKAQAAKAAEEGWELAIIVDEHKPVSAAYLAVWPRELSAHVLQQAHNGSKLHINALSACTASRFPQPATKRKH